MHIFIYTYIYLNMSIIRVTYTHESATCHRVTSQQMLTHNSAHNVMSPACPFGTHQHDKDGNDHEDWWGSTVQAARVID